MPLARPVGAPARYLATERSSLPAPASHVRGRCRLPGCLFLCVLLWTGSFFPYQTLSGKAHSNPLAPGTDRLRLAIGEIEGPPATRISRGPLYWMIVHGLYNIGILADN